MQFKYYFNIVQNHTGEKIPYGSRKLIERFVRRRRPNDNEFSQWVKCTFPSAGADTHDTLRYIRGEDWQDVCLDSSDASADDCPKSGDADTRGPKDDWSLRL